MNDVNKLELLGRVRVVLCRTSHPGNIGSAARAMKTMGLSRLVLVNPLKFPHADANMMAAGATDILESANVCDTLEEALSGCNMVLGLTARRRELSHQPASPRQAALEMLEFAANGEVALVFGNETSGMSNEELILCQRLAHIPANPEYSSLNLAAAVQLMAYELRIAALGDPHEEYQSQHRNPYKRIKLATHDEVEGFFGHLEQMLVTVGYLDPQQPRRLMSRLRRLFVRAGLQQEEVNILRGVFKAVEKGIAAKDTAD
jgi:tRNA/rRNA methyltransferase